MRRRLVTALAALLLLGPAVGAQYRNTLQDLDDSETVRALKGHVAALSAAQLEGRKAGSEGERMAAEYLEEKFREYGIDILSSGSEFGVAAGEDTLHSRNVTGFLQGWDKNLNGHYIVIGARMDNLGMDTLMVNGVPTPRIYYGANGNASGMAILLELAQKLSYARSLLRRSILFVGFGASRETFAGSWYFLHRSFEKDADKIDAMVNLDMLGMSSGGFYAFTSSNEDLNTVVSACRENCCPSRPSSPCSSRIPETISFSMTRKFLPSCSLRAAIRNTTPDRIPSISWISREWKGSWSISTAMCSASATAPGPCSGTMRLRPRPPHPWASLPIAMWT